MAAGTLASPTSIPAAMHSWTGLMTSSTVLVLQQGFELPWEGQWRPVKCQQADNIFSSINYFFSVNVLFRFNEQIIKKSLFVESQLVMAWSPNITTNLFSI